MNSMINEDQDLQQAQTLLAAKSMSDDLQTMAEKLAKMSVEDLMPLVDTMKEQFGQEIANGFNDTMKAAIDAVLNAATEAKETADNSILSMQQGQVPGAGATDIEAAGAPEAAPEMRGDEESDDADEFGATAAAAGPEEEPLGRAKKAAAGEEAPASLEEGMDTTSTGSPGNIKRHYDGPEGWVYQPLTSAGSTQLSRGTKWALRDPKYFDMYKVRGPIYIIHDKANKERYAYQPATGIATDSSDRSVEIPAWASSKIGSLTEGKKPMSAKQAAIFGTKSDKKAAAKDDKTVAAKGDKKVNKKTAAKGDKGEPMTKPPKDKAANEKKDVKESKVEEKAPPGKEAEDFIKSNKAGFKKLYGDRWEEVLYATAWKMFGPKSENVIKTAKMLEAAKANKAKLVKAFESHKKSYAKMVNEGITSDVLRTGYSLEGQTMLDQITDVDGMIGRLKEMLRSEMKAGVHDIIMSEENNRKIASLAESKSQAPWGIVWKDSSKKLQQKFFESEDLRKYWIGLNNASLTESKLVNPVDFDKRIGSLKSRKG